jgi:hypothetical protein
MEIADFGSYHWWPQRVESTLGEKTEAVSQSEMWISKRKVVGNPTRVRVVRALQWQLQQLMPNITVVFDAATAWR